MTHPDGVKVPSWGGFNGSGDVYVDAQGSLWIRQISSVALAGGSMYPDGVKVPCFGGLNGGGDCYVDAQGRIWIRQINPALAGGGTAYFYAADFTAGAASVSGVSYARSGADLYAMNGAHAAAKYAAGALAYEDRGDGLGVGLLSFDGFTNDNGSDLGFSTYGTNGTRGAAVANGPDGNVSGTKADRLYGASGVSVYFQKVYGAAANRRHSAWMRVDTTQALTAPGIFDGDQGRTKGKNLAYDGAFTRYTFYATNAGDGNVQEIWPKGARLPNTFDTAQSGGVVAWGPQAVQGTLADVPLCLGTSGAATPQVAASNFIDSNGDFDIEISGMPIFDDSTYGGTVPLASNGYVFSLNTSAGLIAIRYTATTAIWTVTEGGSDVASTFADGTDAGANSTARGSSIVGFRQSDEVTIRYWHKASQNQAGIRISVNGCRGVDVTWTPAAGAVVATSAACLGSNLGASGGFPMRWRYLRAFTGVVTSGHTEEGLMIGDSTTASHNAVLNMGAAIYTPAEWRSRAGIASIAISSDATSGQYQKWQSCPWRGNSAVKWIVINIGINDISNNVTAATLTASLQTMLTDINTQNPGATVIIEKPNTSSAWNATQQAAFTAYVANIQGSGANPLVGNYVYSSGASDATSTGGFALQTQYQLNGSDSTHCNNAGKLVQGAAVRTTLHANGLL